jgi:glyoxylase-like metal-dependent hydrolase (beta-lactamase superfamily II)
VKFPTHILQREAGYPVLDVTINDVKPNAAVAIQVPANIAQGRAQAAGPIEPMKVSDGIWHFAGASLIIEMKDHVIVVEASTNEERSIATMDWVAKNIPGKPIKYLINTHSHIDHSGGLRGFVAEGSTILTHQVNKAYLEKTLSAPHTLSPDKAQQLGKKPVVEAVGEKKVLTDGTHVIELYHLQNFGHHDGMLIAYFPKEKVLLEADGYNPQPTSATPPNPPSPFTVSLLDNIQRLKLDVQRIVPVHYPADNRVVTMVELTRWVGRGSSTQ